MHGSHTNYPVYIASLLEDLAHNKKVQLFALLNIKFVGTPPIKKDTKQHGKITRTINHHSFRNTNVFAS